MNTVVKWTAPCPPPPPKKLTFQDVPVGEWFVFVGGTLEDRLNLKTDYSYYAPIEGNSHGWCRQCVSSTGTLSTREVKLVDVVIHATKRD